MFEEFVTILSHFSPTKKKQKNYNNEPMKNNRN